MLVKKTVEIVVVDHEKETFYQCFEYGKIFSRLTHFVFLLPLRSPMQLPVSFKDDKVLVGSFEPETTLEGIEVNEPVMLMKFEGIPFDDSSSIFAFEGCKKPKYMEIQLRDKSSRSDELNLNCKKIINFESSEE